MSAPAPAQPPNPRWDAGFTDRVLWDLITHAGTWRPLGRIHAGHVPSFDRCCLIRECLDWGRKLGMVIESDRRRGQRLVGFVHPQRVYRVVPGPKPREDDADETTTQLQLV